MEDFKSVENYLTKKEERSLKRIKLGSEMNHKIFILSIALVAVLPLIPSTNAVDFVLETYLPIFDLNYKLLITIYFGILVSLLIINIVIGVINIFRKMRYRSLLKEIQTLKSTMQ